jgi:hypothetical protein
VNFQHAETRHGAAISAWWDFRYSPIQFSWIPSLSTRRLSLPVSCPEFLNQTFQQTEEQHSENNISFSVQVDSLGKRYRKGLIWLAAIFSENRVGISRKHLKRIETLLTAVRGRVARWYSFTPKIQILLYTGMPWNGK